MCEVDTVCSSSQLHGTRGTHQPEIEWLSARDSVRSLSSDDVLDVDGNRKSVSCELYAQAQRQPSFLAIDFACRSLE